MKLRRFSAVLFGFASFALLVVPPAPAQQTTATAQFTDPANLRGEGVKPRDGRELPIDQGSRGLEQMLRKLNTRASLMLIVAHPDDEDGGMLTYYSRGLGARVAVLTLTRGEGGQNAMTGDFEDALGLLRTQELLSADRYLGVDQFFGTEVDFGFSKTKEEAFKKWTHERVLYDAVRSIRLYRPLVIAAVFIGGVTDGHGQHQVSGEIAQEAFKAAADPTVFPDMIAEGILPWQALKVYARVPMQSISDKGLFDYATGKYTAPRFENYVTGEVTTTTPSADVIVHEGTVDKLLSDSPSDPPRTYVQFARIGLGMQKSQIGGGVRVPPAGTFDVAYHLYGSKLSNQPGKEANFFDGIDTSIEGIGTYSAAPFRPLDEVLLNVGTKIKAAGEHFDPNQSDKTAANLAVALKAVDNAISVVNEFQLGTAYAKENVLHELRIKRVQLNDALLLSLGLTFEASTEAKPNRDISIFSPLSIRTRLGGKSIEAVESGREWLQSAFGGTADGRSDANKPSPWSISGALPIASTLDDPHISLQDQVTRPYFHRSSIEQPVYDLIEPDFRNAPAAAPALSAWASIDYQGTQLRLGGVVEIGAQPVDFVPWVNLSFSFNSQALPSSSKEFHLSISNHSQSQKWSVSISESLGLPPGFTAHASAIDPTSLQRDFIVSLPTPPPTAPFEVTAVAELSTAKSPTSETGGILRPGSMHYQRHPEGYRPIGYGDLPRTNYYTPATVRIVPVDLNLPHATRIAYLPGTGDAVPKALASINLKPDILTVADLTPAKLARYDTVILGVRTYNAHPDLHGAPTQALLDYTRNGGNVLVQYQTAEFTGADAPYPLTLGYAAERVVDETDPVQLIDASAPFLTTPNKITPADFNNWIEERGHGFLSTWDSHYTALTETHDPDEDPQRGGLITANIGKGRWTYCAFALYRQLPEAVPGAFRLFVNLVSPANSR